jgi:hypothetical protein
MLILIPLYAVYEITIIILAYITLFFIPLIKGFWCKNKLLSLKKGTAVYP